MTNWPGPLPKVPSAYSGRPLPGERLDAVVALVGDVEDAPGDGQAAGAGDLPRRAAGAGEEHGVGAVEVEAHDAVVGGVGDVDVAPADRDPAAGRLVGALAGTEVELPERRPRGPPTRRAGVRWG